MGAFFFKWVVAFALCLLAAGCSQGVSNPSTDEADENGFVLVDGGWKFSEWSLEPFYYPEFFDSASYIFPTEDIFLDSLVHLRFLYMNQVTSGFASRVFIFSLSEGAQRYMLSVDTIKKDRPLLGTLMSYWSDDEGVFRDRIKGLVKPIEYKGRLYYPLDSSVLCDFNGEVYASLFNDDGTPYLGDAENPVVADRELEPYPWDFNVNLIVAGYYSETTDGATAEELAEKIKGRINRALNPGGMAVRKVNVLNAKDHPLVGSYFPDSVIIEHNNDDLHKAMDSLACWPGHEGEISIILAYYIYDGIGENGTEWGFSPISGRLCGEDSYGTASYVGISSHGKKESKGGYTSSQIAETTIHELGHFFGLQHTTEIGGIRVDEYEDTPECTDMALNYYGECKDRNYIMFPFVQLDWAYATFSPQETDVIRMYLATVPHK